MTKNWTNIIVFHRIRRIGITFTIRRLALFVHLVLGSQWVEQASRDKPPVWEETGLLATEPQRVLFDGTAFFHSDRINLLLSRTSDVAFSNMHVPSKPCGRFLCRCGWSGEWRDKSVGYAQQWCKSQTPTREKKRYARGYKNP